MLDELHGMVTAMIQAAATARLLGSTVDIPDWWTLREQFDTELAAPPERVDTKQLAMLIAVGLRG
jgi:hypothetical protein